MSSRSYRLKRQEDAAAGMRRIALGRVEDALDELSGTGEEDLATAIHNARKDLKKLRAVVRLTRVELGKSLAKSEDRRYRDAGRALSGTRDAEAKLETLAALASQFGDRLPAEARERWQAALERDRDELADAALSGAASQIGEAVDAIEAGRDRIAEWPLETDSWKLLEPGLSKSYRQGRRAMKRTLAEPRAQRVHEWRKRAKDLRYQLRIVQGARPELLGETTDQMHELTDLLGDHHDLTVLLEDLRRRENVGERDAFEVAIERRQEQLLAGALEIGRRLYAEKPRAFSRRLESYWLAWRDE